MSVSGRFLLDLDDRCKQLLTFRSLIKTVGLVSLFASHSELEQVMLLTLVVEEAQNEWLNESQP